MGDREIFHTGVSHVFVGGIRKELATASASSNSDQGAFGDSYAFRSRCRCCSNTRSKVPLYLAQRSANISIKPLHSYHHAPERLSRTDKCNSFRRFNPHPPCQGRIAPSTRASLSGSEPDGSGRLHPAIINRFERCFRGGLHVRLNPPDPSDFPPSRLRSRWLRPIQKACADDSYRTLATSWRYS